MIQAAFYKHRGNWFDHLARWWTWSRYSHCEIVLGPAPDGSKTRPEKSLCWSSSPRDGGVRSKAIRLDPARWDTVPVAWADADQLAQITDALAGTKYDWPGFFLSQVPAAGLHSKARMFCSEACAAALGLSDGHRLSPHQLNTLLKDINRLEGGSHAN